MQKHKEYCLKITGKQIVKLKSGSIKFKNHVKQLVVLFNIYVDFECNVKRIKSNDKNNASYTKKYQYHIRCTFAYTFVCIGDGFSNPVGKNKFNKFIEAILKEYDYCKK